MFKLFDKLRVYAVDAFKTISGGGKHMAAQVKVQQQLNNLLTGAFLSEVPKQPTGDVAGWSLPQSDVGGTIKRRNPSYVQRQPEHYIIPGFSDGSRWNRRKKKKTKYVNNRDRLAHDLLVDRLVGKKRLLDLEPEYQCQG